ncbi:MAG: nitroreductase family protein [Streptosporangiaceae bacterium]
MPAPQAESLPLLDALHSTPARRYLSPEPIPDDVIWAVLDAAVRGPPGGNQQGWGWVVVTDPAIKQQVAGWYLEGWDRAYGSRREEILAAPPGADGLSPRSFLAAEHLAHHLAEARRCGSSRCCGTRPVPAAPGWAARSTGRCSSSSWPPERTVWGPP